jgi:hypothetical protein
MTQQSTSDAPAVSGSRSTVLRVAAVCCSIALVGGYVAYRSGATLMPGTKSHPMTSTTAPSTSPSTGVTLSPAEGREFMLISSSKSGPVVPPAPPQAATTWPAEHLTLQPKESGTTQPAPTPGRRMMPGSKSAAVFEPPDASRLISAQPATQPTTRPDLRLDE